MRNLLCSVVLGLAVARIPVLAQCDPAVAEKYHLVDWSWPKRLALKPGDRLAICGDSITEQRMYSRILEDYLTMCAPELGVTVRQYGWSGERAGGFLGRMTNDCLRFQPTVATTCYGMNDHEYRPYEPRIGLSYLENMRGMIRGFKANGVRVIVGSPGPVGKMPHWVQSAKGTVTDLNESLARLRDMGVELSLTEKVGFADVFGPMMSAQERAWTRFGTGFAVSGKDGVHPGWAGQTVMAYAFLRGMGLPGEIGTLRVDLSTGRMKSTPGHEVLAGQGGAYRVRSARYPFVPCLEPGQGTAGYPECAAKNGELDDTIASAFQLIPFNQELNRFVLVARGGKAPRYTVTWGGTTKTYPAEMLAKGINLAAEFPCNPFCGQFGKVDAAVAEKQAFETRQVKEIFHGADGKADMEAAVKRTEAERSRLAEAILAAFQPVTHQLTIEPAAN